QVQFVAVVQQPPGQVGADEAGTAGEQDALHKPPSFSGEPAASAAWVTKPAGWIVTRGLDRYPRADTRGSPAPPAGRETTRSRHPVMRRGVEEVLVVEDLQILPRPGLDLGAFLRRQFQRRRPVRLWVGPADRPPRIDLLQRLAVPRRRPQRL